MSYLYDPRVFFAAERTMLAWIRTGVAVMGLGFVVAKFGLFLRYVAHEPLPQDQKTHISLIIGIIMVLLGSLVCVMSLIQFRRFVRTLSEPEIPPRWSFALPILFAWTFACAGLFLALYLFL